MKAVNQCSKQEDVSVPVFMQALLRTLIFRYTMQDDIIVGVRMPCRSGIEISQSVGPFENTLPLVSLSHNRWSQRNLYSFQHTY